MRRVLAWLGARAGFAVECFLYAFRAGRARARDGRDLPVLPVGRPVAPWVSGRCRVPVAVRVPEPRRSSPGK